MNLEHSFILFYFLTSPFLCNSHSGSNQEILSLNLGANWSDDGGFLGVSLDLELISGVPSNSSSSSFLLYPLVSPPKKLKSRTSASRPLVGGDSWRARKHKCLKKETSHINLVLGEDIKLNEIVTLSKMVLVGRFDGHHLGHKLICE